MLPNFGFPFSPGSVQDGRSTSDSFGFARMMGGAERGASPPPRSRGCFIPASMPERMDARTAVMPSFRTYPDASAAATMQCSTSCRGK